MKSKTDPKHIRSNVSEDYAKAVTSDAPGCCSGRNGVQKGVVVKLAGYSDEELSVLPSEAVVNSFGCGNPLAFSLVKAGQTVLDLGSGAGIDLLLAARKVGPTGRVIGVDMTDEMIAKARENIEASGLKNIEVRKGIIEELPVENASVDWVISNCVINLSPEKDRVFHEIVRVLRPGGMMLVSDIVVESLPQEVRDKRELYSSCVSGAISEKAYIAGLEKAGLVDVKVLERLVYDESQLEGLIGSELKEIKEEKPCCAPSCCGGSKKNTARDWAKKVEGKVWSAKITARKR